MKPFFLFLVATIAVPYLGPVCNHFHSHLYILFWILYSLSFPWIPLKGHPSMYSRTCFERSLKVTIGMTLNDTWLHRMGERKVKAKFSKKIILNVALQDRCCSPNPDHGCLTSVIGWELVKLCHWPWSRQNHFYLLNYISPTGIFQREKVVHGEVFQHRHNFLISLTLTILTK